MLTLEDYLRRRSFDDEICRNSYFIDVHAKVKAAFETLQGMEDWEKTTIRYGRGESHGIPYRCLTPTGLNNLLVAGRSISAEQLVQGSVRVMPCCLAMGEAAGMAAAMAVDAASKLGDETVAPDVRRDVNTAGPTRTLGCVPRGHICRTIPPPSRIAHRRREPKRQPLPDTSIACDPNERKQ